MQEIFFKSVKIGEYVVCKCETADNSLIIEAILSALQILHSLFRTVFKFCTVYIYIEGHRQNFKHVKIHTQEFIGSFAFSQILIHHIPGTASPITFMAIVANYDITKSSKPDVYR